MTAPGTSTRQVAWRTLSVIGLGASALFLLTSLIMNVGAGEGLTESVPPAGGTVGPLEVDEPNTVVRVDVRQSVPDGAWSFVTGELLNGNQEYLTGFGDEMWHESGQDADGRWEESVTSYDVKLTLRERGQYYFRFNVESRAETTRLSPIHVAIEPQLASSVPHFAGGMILLIASLAMNFMSGGMLRQMAGG